jgi:hypothetical protein
VLVSHGESCADKRAPDLSETEPNRNMCSLSALADQFKRRADAKARRHEPSVRHDYLSLGVD